jgi:hypothetical protein
VKQLNQFVFMRKPNLKKWRYHALVLVCTSLMWLLGPLASN